MLVDCATYAEGRRIATVDLDSLALAVQERGSFLWLGLSAPSDDEFEHVRIALALPAAATALAVRPHEFASFTSLDDGCNVTLRTLSYNSVLDRMHVGEVSVFVAASYVVSVRFGDSRTLEGVRARLEARPARLALGPAAVIHAILEKIVNDYIPVLRRLESQVIEVERQVFSDAGGRSPAGIFALKRHLLDVFGVVDALSDPLDRLVRSREPWLDDDIVEQLRDLEHQVDRLTNRVRSLSDLLTSAFEANLTYVSVQQNADMRRISSWAAILAVPTLIAGVYGMNFATMPELQAKYGYPFVIAMTVTICAALHRRLKKSGWL